MPFLFFALFAAGILIATRRQSAPSTAAPSSQPAATPSASPSETPAPSAAAPAMPSPSEPVPETYPLYEKISDDAYHLTDAGRSALEHALSSRAAFAPISAYDGTVDGYPFTPEPGGSISYLDLIRLADSSNKLALVTISDMDAIGKTSVAPDQTMIGIVAPENLNALLDGYSSADGTKSARDLLALVE